MRWHCAVCTRALQATLLTSPSRPKPCGRVAAPGALVIDARLEEVDLVPRAVAQRVAVRHAPAAALARAGWRVPRALPAQGLARARIAGAGAILILAPALQAGCWLALQLMLVYTHPLQA